MCQNEERAPDLGKKTSIYAHIAQSKARSNWFCYPDRRTVDGEGAGVAYFTSKDIEQYVVRLAMLV